MYLYLYKRIEVYSYAYIHTYIYAYMEAYGALESAQRANASQAQRSIPMGWLRLVGCLKYRSLLQKSPTKETYILQKRPIF